jgi:serine/threonine-protein kinase
MAPEQFQSTRSVDRRADIYSLGVVLYEMTTGKRPYPGTFSPEVIARIQRGQYRAPRALNPKVTRFTARMIRRMLRPKPERRFADLNGVITRINRHLRIKAHGDNRDLIKRYLEEESPRSIPRRRSRVVPAAVAAAVVILGGIIGWSIDRGYHHEIFQSRNYGAVEVTARVLKEGRSIEEIDPTVTFFPVEDGDAVITTVLDRAPEDESPRFASYRARLVVPVGAYRIDTTLDGSLYRRMTIVPPLAETRRSPIPIPGRREDAYRISVEFLEVPDLPLSLTVSARDEKTGRMIDETLQVSIFRDERLQPFTWFISRTLRTGRDYRFRLQHPDYHPRDVLVQTEPTESDVVLEVELTPKE